MVIRLILTKYKQVLFVFVGFLQQLHRVKSTLNRSRNTRLSNICWFLRGKNFIKLFSFQEKRKEERLSIYNFDPFMVKSHSHPTLVFEICFILICCPYSVDI